MMNVPGCWAVDFTTVRNCVMQVIVGLVWLSAVKIASYGMSVSAYAIPWLTFAKFASTSSMHTTLSCDEIYRAQHGAGESR